MAARSQLDEQIIAGIEACSLSIEEMARLLRQALPHLFCSPPAPPNPSPYLPGSPGKIRDLAARWAAKQALWHPGDLLDADYVARQITTGANGRPVLGKLVSPLFQEDDDDGDDDCL